MTVDDPFRTAFKEWFICPSKREKIMRKIGLLGYVLTAFCLLGILLPALGFWLAPTWASYLAGTGCLLLLGAVTGAGYLFNQLQGVSHEFEEKKRSV